MRRGLVLLAAMSMLALGLPDHAGAQAVPPWFVNPATLPFEALPGTTTERWWGVDEHGAGYRVEVPQDWNGELVLYAHGFRGTNPELTVSNPALRAYLVANGYAWAASSYRANGYAVEEGVEDTRNLLEVFAAETGLTQERTFLTGDSMGGHVAGASIERYPDTYAGALPVCGVMGDVALYDYFQDVNLVAQALAGVEPEIPAGPDYLSETVPAIRAALGYPEDLNGRGHQLSAAIEQLSGGERAGFETALAFWSDPETGTALAGAPFLFGVYGGALSGGQTDPRLSAITGNVGREYQYDTDPAVSEEEAELNAVVARDEAVPGAQPPFPVITGDLPVPVLSLHTTGDLFVPFSMEQIYAREAAANGDAELLVTRAIRDVRHCGFAVQELETAFADLVAWVDGGPRPAGDDVLDPETVADRDFGCAFTLGDRPGFRPCGTPATAARVGADDPVPTALAVSAAAFESAETVVVASAARHLDALLAAPLAGSLEAPVLLSGPGRVPAEVLAEIARLGATSAVLVGDVRALSPLVAAQLERAGLSVERLAGLTPAATAAEVAGRVGGQDAFLVLGDGGEPADAAAVAGLGAFLGEPILLTGARTVPPATLTALKELGITQVTVVGDSGQVADQVVRRLRRLGYDVERLGAAGRYATPGAAAERSVASGMDPREPWIAAGTDVAGAAAAGAATAETGDVLVVVDGTDPHGRSGSLRFLQEQGRTIELLRLVGGPGVLTPEVEARLLEAANG